MQSYAVRWEPGVRIISWRSEDPTAYQEMKYDLYVSSSVETQVSDWAAKTPRRFSSTCTLNFSFSCFRAVFHVPAFPRVPASIY